MRSRFHITEPVLKWFLAASAILLCLSRPAAAEDGASAFRRRIAGHRVDLTVSWKAGISGKQYAGDGELSWQDGRFRFINAEVQIYNDGKSLVSVSQAGREVVVQPSGNTDFLSDPAALASLLGLNPAKSGIVMHYWGGDLKGADITLRNGNSVTVKVVSLSIREASGDGDFFFDVESLDSSWVVTDLR